MQAIISTLFHENILFSVQKTFKNVMQRNQLFSFTSQEVKMALQKFDYFLVLDFEATCDAKKSTLVPQEIIEFPVLKISGKTFEIESVFHEYVQPSVHKILTPYCIELTGINQDMIDGQPQLDEILKKFHRWMEEQNLLTTEVHSAFVTYTDWDLNKMLPSQCEYLGIDVPIYMKKWINIQECLVDETNYWPTKGLKDAMKHMNIQPVGRSHSGIDDCRNTVNVMKFLAKNGCTFSINGPKMKKKL